MMSTRITAALTVAVALLVPQAAERPAGPAAGEKAPDFRATALGGRGEVFELGKAIEKGKRPIVLVFGSST